MIPGTNVTPFLVARGRQPLVPGDPELEERELCPPSMPLEQQVAQVQRYMKEAQKLVMEAREKVMARNQERWDDSHFDVSFEPGELVRLWAHDVDHEHLRSATWPAAGRPSGASAPSQGQKSACL